LFGFKGSGKTYFGKRLGAPFLDTDHCIEEMEGKSVREIVLTKGIAYFRTKERELIRTLEVKNTVIAVGGGTVLDPENVSHLKRLGLLIYLKCSKEVVKSRMLTPPLPTFLDANAPEDAFEQHFEERASLYEQISGKILDLTGKSELAIIRELKQIGECNGK
jgi:shikimate kinase